MIDKLLYEVAALRLFLSQVSHGGRTNRLVGNFKTY